MVARTRLNVTLYIRCLCCLSYNILVNTQRSFVAVQRITKQTVILQQNMLLLIKLYTMKKYGEVVV